MREEKIEEKEFLTLNDSTHDNQSGVYKNYNGRSDWLSKEIKRFAERGYELYKRLPEDGITIFRKIKESLDKQKVKKVIDTGKNPVCTKCSKYISQELKL